MSRTEGFHTSVMRPGLPRERESWRDIAACADTEDPEVFFDRNCRSTAARICGRCAVRSECLADVMAMPGYVRNVGQFRAGQWFAISHR